MKIPLLLSVLLLVAALPARAIEPIVLIKSPDKKESFVYGAVASRKLYWSDKEKKLYALITVDNSRYSGGSEAPEKDTLRFYLPGVEKDEKTKKYFVRGRNDEIIPFAETKKELFFESIQPVRNAVVRIVRTEGAVSVTAEIYKPEEVAAEEKAEKESGAGTNEWQHLDLNKALGN